MNAREDIAAYVLGELGERERLAFERELAQDAELREEVERLRPVVARLHALDPVAWQPAPAPPLRLPDASPPPRRGRRLVLRPAVAAIAAVVLLLAGVGAGLLAAGGDDAGGRPVSLRAVGGGDGHGEARLASGSATVDVSGLPPSARGQFYELWLLNSADDLVALGSFRVPGSGDARVTVPVPGDAADYRFVDLSVEPDDGDPAHSGDSVLRGRVPGAEKGYAASRLDRRQGMQRIVVAAKAGTDETWVADAAAELAKQTGAQVSVVSVDGLELEGLSTMPRAEFQEQAQKTADLMVAHLREQGIEATGDVRSGRVVAGILLYAEEHDGDLIMVGASTRSKVAQRVLGDVPLELVSRSRRPVLVISHPGERG